MGSKLAERHGLGAGTPTKTKFGESTGDRYQVTIIEGGEGSSGVYPIEMLERDVPAAFPTGTRMRANHDGFCEDGGDIRRVIGRTVDTPWREGNKMVTNILVSENWSSYVREFGDVIGLSISAAGEYEETPENWGEDGPYLVGPEGQRRKREVTRLASAAESPYNSIDFVEAPGAKGRITHALEAAKSHLGELNVREAATFGGPVGDRLVAELTASEHSHGGPKEDIEVDEQTLSKMLAESESRTLEAVKASIAEASKPAAEPTEKPTLKATTEALVASGLSDDGRDAVYEALERGESLDKAIEREKGREDRMAERIRKQVAESTTTVQRGFIVPADGGASVTEDADFGDDFDDVIGRLDEHFGRKVAR